MSMRANTSRIRTPWVDTARVTRSTVGPILRWTLVLFASLGIVETALAESGFEITPMVGYRTAGTEISTGIVCATDELFNAPCPDTAESQDAVSLGLIAGYALSDRWWFEVVLNRQEMELDAELITCPACDFQVIDLNLEDLEIISLHLGIQRRWLRDRFQPFVALGAGISRLSTNRTTFGIIDVDEERPSASLAAGVHIPISARLGARFEARGYWVDLPTDEFPFIEDFEQSELAGGLTFRW